MKWIIYCDASSTFGGISFSSSMGSAKERRTDKREIQNAPLYNNNKRDRRRWHFLNINTFFGPKNVDSLCRFHVLFFLLLLLFKKFPHFPQVSNVCSFYTFLGNLFCRFRNLPPFKKKKKVHDR